MVQFKVPTGFNNNFLMCLNVISIIGADVEAKADMKEDLSILKMGAEPNGCCTPGMSTPSKS